MSDEPQRRASDQGWLVRGALLVSLGWDWFEKRLILERVVAIAILLGTINVLAWAKGFAETHTEANGTDAAAIIAAVLAPYMLLQAAAVKFMFDRLGR